MSTSAIPTEAATRVPRRRWGIGVLLGVGILINYFDRINISVAGPQLERAFHIGPAELGLLFSAFFWSYALLQVPGGMVLDRFGVTRVGALERIPVVGRFGDHRARQRLRRHPGRARAARRRRGARLPGQPEGDRLLVPARASARARPRSSTAAAKFSNVIGVPIVGLRDRQSRLALGVLASPRS